MRWSQDLLHGGVTRSMVLFAIPMALGNVMQQLYNVADTWVVGRFIGIEALAAVGSAFSLIVFLNSIQIGLCLGSGTLFSLHYGRGDLTRLRQSIYTSFILIGGITLVLNLLIYLLLDQMMVWLRVPSEVIPLMREYLLILYGGFFFVFFANFLVALLRSLGNSFIPLLFIGLSILLNIILDLLFVIALKWAIAGVAWATLISQLLLALVLLVYVVRRYSDILPRAEERRWSREHVREISTYSLLTCAQQSIMNFGILVVQGLVNSFGTLVMTAFAVAVKVDAFAYMPVQDFGNAFSTFVAQNYGARRGDRIRQGIRSALLITSLFSMLVSLLVFILARPLMLIFVDADQLEVIRIGVSYLRIEGAFYVGIGILFLLYGYFRAIRMPGISLLLTIISLGLRVLLAYLLSSIPSLSYTGIWWSIPIGWFIADLVGILLAIRFRHKAA